jgi:transcriptional regulator with AAA-type ATPase domain
LLKQTPLDVDNNQVRRSFYGKEQAILEGLEPNTANEIRKKLYTIDVVVQIPDKELQRVLRDYADRDVALIVKGIEEGPRERILSAVSERRREFIRLEAEGMGAVLRSEVNAAIEDLLAYIQVLEQKEFFRVGGTQSVKVNVRLICATNIDIERRIQEKEFRLDLFYRINDLTIHLPALRDRGEDILLLAHHFLSRYFEKFAKAPQPLSGESERLMLEYHWPGNVRELESMVKRVVIFGEQEIRKHVEAHRDEKFGTNPRYATAAGHPLAPALLSDSYFENKTLKEINDGIVGQVERRAIERSLKRLGWNRKKTAKELDISYRCLLYKIQQYNLQKNPEIIPD